MLSLAVVGLHVAVIGLTFADWDGRFLMFFFPLLTLYSGVGIATIVWRHGGPHAVGRGSTSLDL